jgi:hypothetical protein
LADPSLCPAVHDAGSTPEDRRQGRASAGAGWVPDHANRPLTGEHVLVGPTA